MTLATRNGKEGYLAAAGLLHGMKLVYLRDHGEVKGGTKEEGEKENMAERHTVKPLFGVGCGEAVSSW